MEGPIVSTNLGQYKGYYVETVGRRRVAAFRGIRYAQPPLKSLRFKEAVKIGKHEGFYDATQDGDDCIQENQVYTKYPVSETEGKKLVGSEDCLFLNVYTPEVEPAKRYPVLVFIHGGGYYKGTCSYNWHGPQVLLDKDLILVTITYRLGVFGFLTVDDEVIPSNLGLKDQSLALNWIKENISSFGGDPQNITVSGNSAGGACAQLHMLSPRSKGILRGCISESGSLACPWAMLPRKKAMSIGLKLASLLDCPTSPSDMLAALQKKSVEEIMAAVATIKAGNKLLLWDTMFAPVLELRPGGFITKEDISAGSSLPWMAGITHDEGFLFYRDNYKMGDGNLTQVQKNYIEILPVVFGFEGHSQQAAIAEEIKRFYFGDQDISDKTVTQYVNMLSDGVFIHDLVRCVRQHKGETHLYLLSHLGARSLTNELPIRGVCHADELFYLFPFSKTNHKLEFTDDDLKVKQLFTDTWFNFSSFREPTPQGDKVWPESKAGLHYVSFTSDGLRPSMKLFNDRMDFWDEITRKYSICKGAFNVY